MNFIIMYAVACLTCVQINQKLIVKILDDNLSFDIVAVSYLVEKSPSTSINYP